MATEESIESLQDNLRYASDSLRRDQEALRKASALFPYDWEVQENLKCSGYYCEWARATIAELLADPVRCNDRTLLNEMDKGAFSIAKNIGFYLLGISLKQKIARSAVDPVVRGAWKKDTLLPVKGILRERLIVLMKPLGHFMTHIGQLREPQYYPWKERRTPEEINALSSTAVMVEKEIARLLSTYGAMVAYGRYLQFETILDSYEYFEAYALNEVIR